MVVKNVMLLLTIFYIATCSLKLVYHQYIYVWLLLYSFPIVDGVSFIKSGDVKRRKVLPRSTEDKLRRDLLAGDQIIKDTSLYSCGNTCNFDMCLKLCKDVQFVYGIRLKLFGTPDTPKASTTRREFAFNCLKDNCVTDAENKVHWRYFLQHHEVCCKAFTFITGISRMMISRLKSRILRDGDRAVDSDRVPFGIKAGGSKRNLMKDQGMAMAWLRGMAKRLGQFIPNAKETRLPFGKKKQVFDYYAAEMRLRGVTPIKYAAFLIRWSQDPECMSIKLCKKKGTFAQCNACADFAVELGKCKEANAAEDVKKRWNVHIDRVMKCRQIYYDKRDEAFAQPDKIVCLIADIMDQAKTTLPHFKRMKKSWSSKWWLRQCLMGVKVHGQRMDHYIANARVGTGGGSNFTIECILRTLRKLSEENYAAEGGKLPPKLYMQLDNCSGDNKNYAILAFCNFLIDQGIFEQVEVGFLPVGHTHEDIDQGFSVLSRHLRKVDCLSFSSFVKEDRAAFNNPLEKPNVVLVNVKRDFKSWIEQPGALYKDRVGILDVRYLRVLRYSRSKQLAALDMKKQQNKRRAEDRLKISSEIKELRARLFALSKDRPSTFDGDDEAYEQFKLSLDRQMQDASDRLHQHSSQTEEESTPPSNPELRAAREEELRKGKDPIVFHYKAEMDDPLFLPLYAEGVQYWLQLPQGEPSICNHVKSWKDDRDDGKKTEFETVKENILLFMNDSKSDLTEAERKDWHDWIQEQEKVAEDYIHETPWDFPSCVPFNEIETRYSREPQDLQELMTHDGFTKSARRIRMSGAAERAQHELELEKASKYAKISKGDLIMFWEDVVADEDIEEELANSYKNMNVIELRTPLVMGEALEDCDVTIPGHHFLVRRFRQPEGDMNKGFQPGVLSNGQMWRMNICRDSVVYVNVQTTSKSTSTSRYLSIATKRGLCESAPVSGMFEVVSGGKMVRKLQ